MAALLLRQGRAWFLKVKGSRASGREYAQSPDDERSPDGQLRPPWWGPLTRLPGGGEGSGRGQGAGEQTPTPDGPPPDRISRRACGVGCWGHGTGGALRFRCRRPPRAVRSVRDGVLLNPKRKGGNVWVPGWPITYLAAPERPQTRSRYLVYEKGRKKGFLSPYVRAKATSLYLT